jgi:hypothetical protein
MKIVKESINEKFTKDSDPISDMGIGIINKITSEALLYLYGYSNEDIEEVEKENPEFGNQINAAIELQLKGIIKPGNYFDWQNEYELQDYIRKNAKDRYVYNGTPNTSGCWVIFSKIELPSADEIIEVF